MLTLILCLCALLLLLFFCVRWYVKSKDDFWPKQNVKLLNLNEVEGFWKRWTFQFNLTEFHLKVYKILKNAGVKTGGGLMEFRTPVFYLMDLDLLRLVLVKDFDYFPDRRIFNLKGGDPIVTRMMTNLAGQEWKDLRSTMSPTFTTGKIKRMFHHFNNCGQHLVDYLHTKGKEAEGQGVDNVVDFQDAFGRYTMDAIASIAFGLETDVFKEETSMFREMAKRFQSFTMWRLLKAIFAMFLPSLGNLLKIRFSDQPSMDFFTTMTTSNMAQRREEGKGKRQDFLDIMLEASSGQLTGDDDPLDNFEKDAQIEFSNGKKGTLDDETIIAQCLLFFSAGSDTMETLLTFTSYVLAIHPEIQEKLADEIGRTMEENGGTLSYEDIHKMEYLDMVVSETLRLFPPATLTERTCVRDYTIPGTTITIPKGGRVIVPIAGIHKDSDYYPNPDKFNPENFNKENKAKRHAYAYLPFGHGPRNCIAMRFALTEAKSAIAQLIHNFRIEPSAKTQIPVKFSKKNFIIKPENGMFLKFTSR